MMQDAHKALEAMSRAAKAALASCRAVFKSGAVTSTRANFPADLMALRQHSFNLNVVAV